MPKFAPAGPLALDPRAFGAAHQDSSTAPNRMVDGAMVVTVGGPLTMRRDPYLVVDSYEAILRRVDDALEAKPRAVVLAINSPGGMAQGCFESARQLRAKCKAAGVPLLAYVEGSACSAAYALACAAEQIAVTPTSAVGSIGVFDALVDTTQADAAMGVTFRVLSSGSRKLDGNPHVPMTDEAVAAAQARVDHLAGLFFGLVEELRGMSAEDVRALDGGIAIGREALAQRLADVEVSSLSQLIGMIPAQVQNMDEIRSALQAILDNPDSSDEEKAKAKAALAALDGTPAEEPEANTETEPEANTETEPEPEAKAKAKAKAEAPEEEETEGAQALAAVREIKAQIQANAEKAERDALLASRPDLTDALRASLSKAPLETVREMLPTIPRLALDPAAAASVSFTQGKGQGGPAPHLAPQAKAELDARMGLTQTAYGIVDNGNEQLFGAPVPTK